MEAASDLDASGLTEAARDAWRHEAKRLDQRLASEINEANWVRRKWRRAENKAELLRLENDALRREVESLKEDLDLVLGEARRGPILIINL